VRLQRRQKLLHIGRDLTAISPVAESRRPARRLIIVRPMDEHEFIQERESEPERTSTVLSGWETVVFQVEDVPPDD
jgi:hypothetical protein